jgi:polyisoprenoid-binding protein YceI
MSENMTRAIIYICLGVLFPAGITAYGQSAPAAAPRVKAYDIGKNGKEKFSASLRLPAVRGGHILRPHALEGVIFFGDTPADAALAFRIPVATLEGVDPRLDADVARSAGLDGREHATITFESTSVVPTPGMPNNYRIRGKLTLKGIAKDVLFEGAIVEAAVPVDAKERGFKGEMVYMKLACVLKPEDFGIQRPPLAPEADAEAREQLKGDPQEMNLKLDGFALTNDKPKRPIAATLKAILGDDAAPASRPAAPASQPAAESTAGPASRPSEK